ncbi:MAG: hypothetical protein CL624_04465 [Arcobacter sp.]|nr:hypothetical protein [Arcobacter sp.]|tara:strand:- start:4336 stop:6396 length:2061 start_codon:yes stop_codon:yes gene_type:complete
MIDKNSNGIDLYNSLITLNNHLTTIERERILTLKDNQFPGGIILSENSYYVIAFSQKEFKMLSTLINSFIGKNYSSFDGHLINLDNTIQIERILINHNISLVSKFDVHSSLKDTVEVLVSRMINIYKTSSYNLNSISLSIGKLIDDFKESIYITKDINNAKNIISRIKQEHRLDALNITFMEIELAYAFKSWDDIINHKLIYQILHARKPLTIRLHIIEAFFYNYLYISSNVKENYSSYIKCNILHLLTHCPSNSTDIVKYMYLLAYSFDDINYKNISMIDNDYRDNPFLTEIEKEDIKEKLLQENINQDNTINNDTYLSTKASVIEANSIDTLDKINTANTKIKKLDTKEQEELKSKILSNEINTSTPTNWLEWISLLSKIEFKESLVVAEKGLEEWNIDLLTNDPININNLSKRILSIDDQFPLRRFIIAVPLFIESLKRNRQYPNPLCFEVYLSILEVISIYEVQDQKTLILSQDIFESILMISPKSSDYDNIIQIIEIIIQGINGKHYINWLIDFAEVLVSYNTSNINSRNKLLELILMQIYEQKDWIEQYQLNFLIKLSSIIDLSSLFKELLINEVVEENDRFEKYIGKTIGIYTLSESAGKNAKEYLESHIEKVRILLNHDKASTPGLRHISEVSDYMVIVTQSAKHAATGEIQKIRRQNNKEILFPLGKGSSSIIKSLF